MLGEVLKSGKASLFKTSPSTLAITVLEAHKAPGYEAGGTRRCNYVNSVEILHLSNFSEL